MQTSPVSVKETLKYTEYSAEKRDLVEHARLIVQARMYCMRSKIFQTKCTQHLRCKQRIRKQTIEIWGRIYDKYN
jgi:hypothetical protein